MNAFKTLCQQMKYDPFKKRNRKINRISVAVAMMIFPSACAIVYAQGKEPFTENGVWFWFPVFVALCLGSIAVLLPWRTLGRWLWRWWTGREFERKPVAEKPAEANAADFVDSTLPWSVSCLVNDGRGWRTLSTSCRDTARLNVEPLDEEGCGYKITLNSAVGTSFGLNPETGELDPIATSVTRDGKTTVTLVEGPALEAQKEASAAAWHDAIEKMRRGGDVIVNEISKVEVVNPTETPEQFVRRICPNAKLVPYGQKWRVDFGEEIDERGDTETWNKHHTQEEAWQDAKDELLWYGNDAIKKKIANPLAGLTAEQIAARVNRGEPVRVKDAVEALGFKRPTSDDAIISDPVRIKAEMLRQHMEGHQQGTTP